MLTTASYLNLGISHISALKQMPQVGHFESMQHPKQIPL